MKHILVRNVNEALFVGVRMMLNERMNIRNIAPRGGEETLEYVGPVCTTYTNPLERVLFEPIRDANPFFHLMESLWIIEGRSDVAWLGRFNKQMEKYSDDGVRFHAAYGNRLRHSNGDQISRVIELLKKEPYTRRAALQIWDAGRDLGSNSLDLPCNTMLFLKIRDDKLHLTVSCRSNDMVWGAYGANAVQFSVLLEYIAAMVGVEVGQYRQISDSYHVYTSNPQWPLLADAYGSDLHSKDCDWYVFPKEQKVVECTGSNGIQLFPLVTYKDEWDNELHSFIRMTDRDYYDYTIIPQGFADPFFSDVAAPMYNAWMTYKNCRAGSVNISPAIDLAYTIAADDWRIACVNWLRRREDKV